MTSPRIHAACFLTFAGLLAGATQAAQVNVLAKVTYLGTYAIEIEVAEFTGASSIDLVHPVLGTFPLFFDAGEANWDIEAEDLEFSDIETFFDSSFQLDIAHGGGQSIYGFPNLGPPQSGDFPVPASGLGIDGSVNAFRPTASWTGGDDTADAMIVTYAAGDDEFTNGFETAAANSSSTLMVDLLPGFYDVALGFYYYIDTIPFDSITGDDVLDTDEFDVFLVGETFAGYEAVIPLPAAAWLFASGLGLLGLFRQRDS